MAQNIARLPAKIKLISTNKWRILIFFSRGAGDWIRTSDSHVGNVALYH